MTKKRMEAFRKKPINCVYVLIDPRKEKSKHSLWSFNGEPFYVGRSCQVITRYETHLHTDEVTRRGQFRKSVIDKIYDSGLIPEIRIIKDDLTFDEANELEERMIRLIGRRTLKTGPLTNMTGGGEGGYRRHVPKKMRNHLRELNYTKWLPSHIDSFSMWSNVFEYVGGYHGRHETAEYRCKIHKKIMSMASEVTKRVRSGKSPCPECNMSLFRTNISRGRKNLPLLATTPKTHVRLINLIEKIPQKERKRIPEKDLNLFTFRDNHC